ncbi:hypothetical protein HDU79_003895 [Rhizoclosmatium sp. JEL0117]|nr:hypothetical protein HDU79_003895 [Rhizoclosmatium sp. JEL0117]
MSFATKMTVQVPNEHKHALRGETWKSYKDIVREGIRICQQEIDLGVSDKRHRKLQTLIGRLKKKLPQAPFDHCRALLGEQREKIIKIAADVGKGNKDLARFARVALESKHRSVADWSKGLEDTDNLPEPLNSDLFISSDERQSVVSMGSSSSIRSGLSRLSSECSNTELKQNVCLLTRQTLDSKERATSLKVAEDSCLTAFKTWLDQNEVNADSMEMIHLVKAVMLSGKIRFPFTQLVMTNCTTGRNLAAHAGKDLYPCAKDLIGLSAVNYYVISCNYMMGDLNGRQELLRNTGRDASRELLRLVLLMKLNINPLKSVYAPLVTAKRLPSGPKAGLQVCHTGVLPSAHVLLALDLLMEFTIDEVELCCKNNRVLCSSYSLTNMLRGIEARCVDLFHTGALTLFGTREELYILPNYIKFATRIHNAGLMRNSKEYISDNIGMCQLIQLFTPYLEMLCVMSVPYNRTKVHLMAFEALLFAFVETITETPLGDIVYAPVQVAAAAEPPDKKKVKERRGWFAWF